jgi:uncharacterized membrane protein
MKHRFWQIDFVRGVAITGMVFYHFLVDLEMIYSIPIGVYKIPVVLLARVVATIFILLVGVSGATKFEIIKDAGIKKVSLSFIKRAGIILFWAGIITVVTYIMFPNNFIFFGILHFIGVATILMVPFLYLKNNYLLGITVILFLGLGFVVPEIKMSTFDYFPLIPWFGVVVLGIVAGRVIKFNKSNKTNLLAEMGQKSLLIYLLHQPILWGTLWIVKRMT